MQQQNRYVVFICMYAKYLKVVQTFLIHKIQIAYKFMDDLYFYKTFWGKKMSFDIYALLSIKISKRLKNCPLYNLNMCKILQNPAFYKLDFKISLINSFKGSDRLFKVVELSMQCCGKLLSDLFETYQTF